MTEPTEQRFTALRAVLIVGAVYDILFGIPILAFPEPLANLLGLALPEQQVYLRLNGLFLLILAGFYLVTAVDPGRRLGFVAVAIAGRAAGAVYFSAFSLGFGGDAVFLLLGVGDLLFAVLTAGAMWTAGWSIRGNRG
jgi:uncharacterized membrane protein